MNKWSYGCLLIGLAVTSLAQGGTMPCIAPQVTRPDMGLGAYQNVPAEGGTFSVLVITQTAELCGRGLSESSDFVTITQGAGTEKVTYAVSPNTGAARTAVLMGSSGEERSYFEVRQAAASTSTPAPAPSTALSSDVSVLGAQRTCSNIAMSVIKSGATLKPGTWVLSPSRQFKLVYQTDGNLVLYRATGEVVWANSKFTPGGTVRMQADGNLVSYDTANKALWASNTRVAGSVVAVQDDGNLVIYGATGCTPSWASRR